MLELDLLAPTDANCLRLDFAFYSEEYPEYVNSFYNDAFIAELDQTTWASTPDQVDDQIRDPDNFAFDNNGEVVSINSTGSTSMNDINPGGTTYDGSTVLLEAATKVSPGEHKLYTSPSSTRATECSTRRPSWTTYASRKSVTLTLAADREHNPWKRSRGRRSL